MSCLSEETPVQPKRALRLFFPLERSPCLRRFLSLPSYLGQFGGIVSEGFVPFFFSFPAVVLSFPLPPFWNALNRSVPPSPKLSFFLLQGARGRWSFPPGRSSFFPFFSFKLSADNFSEPPFVFWSPISVRCAEGKDDKFPPFTPSEIVDNNVRPPFSFFSLLPG